MVSRRHFGCGGVRGPGGTHHRHPFPPRPPPDLFEQEGREGGGGGSSNRNEGGRVVRVGQQSEQREEGSDVRSGESVGCGGLGGDVASS